MPVVVGINGFSFDTENEKDLLQKKSKEYGVPIISSTHWADGGAGVAEIAETIVKVIEESENNFQFLYPDEMPLWDKMDTIAKKIYGASGISANASVRAEIDELQNNGYGHYPVCVAKTQYSFSTNPSLRGAPSNHEIPIREVSSVVRGRVYSYGLRRHNDDAGSMESTSKRKD